jgi:hypothetical protein
MATLDNNFSFFQKKMKSISLPFQEKKALQEEHVMSRMFT